MSPHVTCHASSKQGLHYTMTKLKVFSALTFLLGCSYFASVGAASRYYGSPRSGRSTFDFYLVRFDEIISIAFLIIAVLTLREFIKSATVREWIKNYPNQFSSLACALFVSILFSQDIWLGIKILPWAIGLSALIYPILTFAMRKSKDDFLFYSLLLSYGIASLLNLTSSNQFLITYPVLLVAGLARTDTRLSKYLSIAALGGAYWSLYTYAYKFKVSAASLHKLPADNIEYLVIGYAFLNSWGIYFLLISAIFSTSLMLTYRYEKYFQKSNIDRGWCLQVYSNTISHVPMVLTIFLPAVMVGIYVTDGYSGRLGAGMFALFAILTKLFIIFISIAGIRLSLRQYRDRAIIISHQDGAISFPQTSNTPQNISPKKRYTISNINIKYQPGELEQFIVNNRKGDVYFAGGTGPEGAGLLAASVAMTAADGVAKAARGIGEATGIAMRNYQKTKNGWHIAVQMVSESGEESVFFIPNVRANVASNVQSLLLGKC